MTRPRHAGQRNALISQRLLKVSSDPYRRSQYLAPTATLAGKIMNDSNKINALS